MIKMSFFSLKQKKDQINYDNIQNYITYIKNNNDYPYNILFQMYVEEIAKIDHILENRLYFNKNKFIRFFCLENIDFYKRDGINEIGCLHKFIRKCRNIKIFKALFKYHHNMISIFYLYNKDYYKKNIIKYCKKYNIRIGLAYFDNKYCKYIKKYKIPLYINLYCSDDISVIINILKKNKIVLHGKSDYNGYYKIEIN